jgi:hypothetical protein
VQAVEVGLALLGERLEVGRQGGGSRRPVGGFGTKPVEALTLSYQ